MSAAGAAAPAAPLVVNGWSIFAHPLFCEQLENLTAQVEELKRTDPSNYQRKNATKRLAAINALAFKTIPENPGRPDYRQGNTLGEDHTHWFRVTFFQQYRLFFRYHGPSKIIVLGWVNDESTLRAYESKDDAYRVFRKMLDRGKPPTAWKQLLAESAAPAAAERLRRVSRGPGTGSR